MEQLTKATYSIDEESYLRLRACLGGVGALYNVSFNSTDNTFDEALSSIHESLTHIIDSIDVNRGFKHHPLKDLKQ